MSPPQVLIPTLSFFPTQSLLPLAIISRRFHSLILRILHFRLLLAASLPEYKLILEAYHPSRRNTDPYLFCTYLGTDGLSSQHEGEGSLYEDCENETGRLAKLGALYSRFRPERPGVEGSMPLRRIAGATPVQNQAGSTSQPIYANAGDGGNIKVSHVINLDADELFGQFCAYSSLVRLGPRRGVFLSTVPIVSVGQGVMRVWRQWLRDRARESRRSEQENSKSSHEPILNRSSTTLCPNIGQDTYIMWTDYRRNVGLRVAVYSRDGKCYDDGSDLDEVPLSFSIEIQGTSLLPSTPSRFPLPPFPLSLPQFLLPAPSSFPTSSQPYFLVITDKNTQNLWSEQRTSSSPSSNLPTTASTDQVKLSFSGISLLS